MKRVVAVAVGAALLLGIPAILARADTAPPSRVLSHFETDVAGNTIDRDAGYSVAEPGTKNALWLFGDSTWTGGGFWFGTTAAVGPYTAGLVPSGLTEVPAPPAAISAPSSRAPQGFLPAFPAGLSKPDGTPCTGTGAIPASWPVGAAAVPGSSSVLIAYTDVCETSTITVERMSIVEYNPASNSVSGNAQLFFNAAGLPFQEMLGSPVFSGGYLYLFGSTCDSEAFGACAAGRIIVARTPASSWANGTAYRFWTGSTWSANDALATSVIPAAKPVSQVYAGDFSRVGKGFAIVEQNDLAGDFTVWRSSSLTGGWTSATGTAPCATGTGLNLCRAYIGHPELSTSADLLMSFYNPGDHHLSVLAFPW